MNTVWSDFARMIFNVQVSVEGDEPPQAPPLLAAGSSTRAGRVSYSGGRSAMGAAALAAAAAAAGPELAQGAGYEGEDGLAEPLPVVQQRTVGAEEQIGRNDPCWCGSGKKYKLCHGAA